jgi:subtilase family serine protease
MLSLAPKTGLAAIILALTAGSALAGVPYPTRQSPAPLDRGVLDAEAAATPITVTVALKLHDLPGAEKMLRRVSTRGDALYRHYLTPAQFAAKFGPTDADVESVRSYFSHLGLTVERDSTTTLHVTGLPARFESAFQVSLHQFEVPASASTPAYSYRAPMQKPAMPSAIAGVALNVFGLDTRPMFHPNIQRAASTKLPPATGHMPVGATTPPDPVGEWTVTDFADYYNVTPLYSASIEGKGQTVGIITLASFTPSDAFTYWKSLKLKVSKTRITEVEVDGGSGAPSDESGSDETTLDVEQSGGLAPSAAVIVYEAPNTSQGYVDAFAKSVDANKADALSTSWGEWEYYDNLANSPVTNPTGGKTTSALAATHQVLVQAGTQGESMFAAAGDSGAYDVNREQAPPDFSLALTVDYPASDPAITAAGGTTLPATLYFDSGFFEVTIPAERAWGWDYLVDLCTDIGYDPIECGILPVGGGGGVSVANKVPSYQSGVAGVQKSQPDQALLDEDTVPPTTIYALPAAYAGRNVPDLAMNADPYTGYELGYTSSSTGSYAVYTNYGGTSFVAPQLCGVTQLLDENAGARLGFLNTVVYALAAKNGYTGSKPALRAISAGTNEFYSGSSGYNPAAGLGSINVANLAAATK